MALTRPRYSQIYDTDYKQSVRVATTADVGNLLATGNMTNSVDNVTLATNDRVLVKDQTDAKQNGLYRVAAVGTGSNGTWIRTLDADANDKVTSGMTTTISEGDTNSGKTFKLSTPDPIILGTTNLTFIDPFVVTASAGGAINQVQFNDTGSVLGASPGFTFDKTSNAVSVSGSISTANISVNGNVSATRFFGDGSQLTGIDSTSIKNGTNSFVITHANGNVTVKGNLVPSANLIYDIGSPTQRWATGYFAGNTLDLGGSQISVNSVTGTFTFTSNGISTDLGGTSTFNTLGSASIGGNLTVQGELYIAGNTTTISTNNAVFNDALIYLANGNPTDFLDIGTVGNFTRSSLFQHTGFVRDATDGVWKLFEGVEPVPDTTIDFGSASYSTALIGNLVTRSNVTIGGNTRLSGALLNSAGLGGDPGQLLQSTGTGITWATVDLTTNAITEDDTSVTASDPYVIINTNGISTANIGYDTTYLYSQNLELSGNIKIAGTGRRFFADMSAATQSDRFAFQTSTLNNNTNILGIPNGTSSQTTWQAFGNSDPNNAHRIFFGTVNSTDTRIVSDATGTANVRPMVFIVGAAEFLRIDPIYGNVGIGNSSPRHTLSVAGDLFVGNITTSSNAVANIGSVSNRFRTVHAQATQAQYADLAEIYTSDQQYPGGTVVVFGGSAEVTQSHSSHDPRIAGVVSTDPAYLMNSTATGVPVALQGRVPCRVLGPVSKGDRVVSSHIPGVAQRLDLEQYQPGCIIGKALQAIDSADILIIEVVVGRV